MPLAHDQHKNIRSLIDTSGVGAYEEVHDELFDHLVQAIESRMSDGLSFTQGQQQAPEEMGGMAGLANIEAAYIRTTEKQVWQSCKAYSAVYLQSFRWVIPVAPGLILRFFFAEAHFMWVSMGTWAIFLSMLYLPARRWNYSLAKGGRRSSCLVKG
jgi:hypothetical protein